MVVKKMFGWMQGMAVHLGVRIIIFVGCFVSNLTLNTLNDDWF
jgi:hypothetical protein